MARLSGGRAGAEVLLFRRLGVDWDNAERAELHGVLRFLIEAGQPAEIEEGVSDEGDPWCAFCDSHTGDVKIHVARIDGRYVVHAAMLRAPISGRSIRDCAERFFDAAGPGASAARPSGPNVYMHPVSLMMALFVAMFVQARIQDDAYPAWDDDSVTGAAPGASGAVHPATGGHPVSAAPGWMRLVSQQIADHLDALLRNRGGESATYAAAQAQGQSGAQASVLALTSAAALAAALIETHRADESLLFSGVDQVTVAHDAQAAEVTAAAMAEAALTAATANAATYAALAPEATEIFARSTSDPAPAVATLSTAATKDDAAIPPAANPPAANLPAADLDAALDNALSRLADGQSEPQAEAAPVSASTADPGAPMPPETDPRTLAQGGVETIATLVALGLKPDHMSSAWSALNFLLAAERASPGDVAPPISVAARLDEPTQTATSVAPTPPEAAVAISDEVAVHTDGRALAFIALFMARVDAFELRSSGDDLQLIDTDVIDGATRGAQFTRSVDFDDGSTVVLTGFFADFGWGADLFAFA